MELTLFLMEKFNQSIFLFINQYAGKNDLLDLLLISAAEAMPYIFIGVLIYLYFNSNIEKKGASINAGLSVLLGMLISYVISIFYQHPRPFVENLGTQLIEHAPDSSFPSDHTTFIFSIAVMLLFNKTTRVLGMVLFILSLVSGLSRVFSGIHFPLDIAGAILVAIFSSAIVFSFRNKTSQLLSLLLEKSPHGKLDKDTNS